MVRADFGDTVIAHATKDGLLCFDGAHADLACQSVTADSEAGMRIRRDTLVFLFMVAAGNALGFERRLEVVMDVSDGYHIAFKDASIKPGDCDRIEKEMRRLCETGERISKVFLPFYEAIRLLESCRKDTAIELVKSLNEPSVALYECCGTYCLSIGSMAESFAGISFFNLRECNGSGFILQLAREDRDETNEERIANRSTPYDALYDDSANRRAVFAHSASLSVGHLNRLIAENGVGERIAKCESLQEREIIRIASLVVKQRKSGCRVVFVAGPSSSGKTTFAEKLRMKLEDFSVQAVKISLDDYYLTKDKVPKNELGEPDVECPESIDANLFRKDLSDLLLGKEVAPPRFEFNFNGIGRRLVSQESISLAKDGVLVVEGLHALNSRFSKGLIDENGMLKVFISPSICLNLDECMQISHTDIRFLRRLVRDFRKRGASALETISMWPMVLRSERKHVLPYQLSADAGMVFFSALEYEVSVLSVFAIPLLRTLRPEDGFECYSYARRLLEILSKVNPLPSDLVPKSSILQEFIA